MKGGIRKMFWDKKSTKEEGKLSGPKPIPGLVQNYLVADRKMEPNLVKLLKTVERKSSNDGTFAIRVFDDSEAIAMKAQVKDYTTLDECPDLVIYEGWYDEKAKQVQLEEKKKVNWDTPIFTQAEIQQKIEVLSEPGSTIFFYAARGGTHGGPLGMGATVVQLNPDYPGKKQKKYIVYVADVIDMQPVGKGQKLWDSDKPRDIAHWIKEGHQKRIY
jgi:hypothetical protein